jgi:uncharacterized protein (DUF433 family)
MKNLLGKIIIDPKIMVGKPVIKGTRITVQQILGLLGQGTTIEDILHEYPHISKEDIYACLLFAQQALDNSVFAPFSTGNAI